ncbi:MAG: hypothetical protein ACI8RD_008059 [Bacillariaceae sp.]|jgi:hypothetical protein
MVLIDWLIMDSIRYDDRKKNTELQFVTVPIIIVGGISQIIVIVIVVIVIVIVIVIVVVIINLVY